MMPDTGMFSINGSYQILKEDGVKVLHSVCQQIWKTQQRPQDWKRSVFTPIPKKGNAKECSNYRTIALISHTSKVMLKILQARFQQYMNHELPDVQAGFRKAEEPEINLPTSNGPSKKQESSRKTPISALLTMPKTLTVWITRKVNKSIEIILQTYRTVNILFHSLLKALTTFIKQCNMSLRVLLSVFSM